jgi:drug/metabolite transporter (DMT)-like permease
MEIFSTLVLKKNLTTKVPALVFQVEVSKCFISLIFWLFLKIIEWKTNPTVIPPEILSESDCDEPRRQNIETTNVEKFKNLFFECFSFFLPAFLLAVAQNLSIWVLLYLDMTTFQTLMNTRIIVTATLYRIFFKKKFSRIQYVSFVLLLSSILISRLNYENNSGFSFNFLLGFFVMFWIVSCDSLSNVILEMMMKNKFERSLFFQNFSLYFHGIWINLVFYFLREFFMGTLEFSFKIFHNYNTFTVLTSISMMMLGFTKNGVLKYLDTIALIFSNTSTVVILTLITGIASKNFMSVHFLLSITCVCCSVLIYVTEDEKMKLEETYFNVLMTKTEF